MAKVRVRANERLIATNAVNSRYKLLAARAKQNYEEMLARLDLQLLEEENEYEEEECTECQGFGYNALDLYNVRDCDYCNGCGSI